MEKKYIEIDKRVKERERGGIRERYRGGIRERYRERNTERKRRQVFGNQCLCSRVGFSLRRVILREMREQGEKV